METDKQEQKYSKDLKKRFNKWTWWYISRWRKKNCKKKLSIVFKEKNVWKKRKK